MLDAKTTKIIRLKNWKPTARMILLLIHDHKDMDGNALLSLNEFVTELGIAITTVKEQISLMVQKGLLNRKKVGEKHFYRINYEALSKEN